ncbi:hypothetical protein HID58_095391 [Brassica napus]|uniref:Uncharacterized protein n=1 Tax=Brassica napus TaxID=3708 RepID=A0ABQ7X663_BRANA|nr:hypothetical protein HID58_095391 [Brassica napus]
MEKGKHIEMIPGDWKGCNESEINNCPETLSLIERCQTDFLSSFLRITEALCSARIYGVQVEDQWTKEFRVKLHLVSSNLLRSIRLGRVQDCKHLVN